VSPGGPTSPSQPEQASAVDERQTTRSVSQLACDHRDKDAETTLYATIDDAVDALRHHYDTDAINAVVI
jgi:hypothetical protein